MSETVGLTFPEEPAEKPVESEEPEPEKPAPRKRARRKTEPEAE